MATIYRNVNTYSETVTGDTENTDPVAGGNQSLGRWPEFGVYGGVTDTFSGNNFNSVHPGTGTNPALGQDVDYFAFVVGNGSNGTVTPGETIYFHLSDTLGSNISLEYRVETPSYYGTYGPYGHYAFYLQSADGLNGYLTIPSVDDSGNAIVSGDVVAIALTNYDTGFDSYTIQFSTSGVSGPSRKEKGPDLNNNGHGDTVWESSSLGLYDWDMNGVSISSQPVKYNGTPVAPDSSWSNVLTDDFNGDGDTDFLWRRTDGTLALWTMNGSNVVSSSPLTYGGQQVRPGANWNIYSAGYFDGSNLGLIWRDDFGTIAFWGMSGSTITTSTGIHDITGASVNPDPSWQIAGTGDFNGDGRSDLLWRNQSGALAEWQMNGSTISGSAGITSHGAAVAPDLSWDVAAIGYFGNTTTTDMIWHNTAGALIYWTMNGGAITSSSAVTYNGVTVNPDPSWKIVEVADFNGDGRSDLLWRSSTSGQLSEWFMNGSTIASVGTPNVNGTPVSPDLSWNVQNQRPAIFG